MDPVVELSFGNARVPGLVIFLEPFSCGHTPCIDVVFGPTAANNYWSSTSDALGPSDAWLVGFNIGNVSIFDKGDSWRVRAVRGGR